MAAGDCKLAYGPSTDLTTTNLQGLATSASWTVGWESAVVDNTSNLYEDYLLSGFIHVHDDAALTASQQIRIYVVSMMSDDQYAGPLDGTESNTEDWSEALTMPSVCKMAACITPATTQNLIYPFGQLSVANLFDDICPPKFSIFITHSTGQNLHTSGNQVTIQGVYHTIAQS